MKEKLMSMLEVLAEKLGTTTELLWSVLVKQAEVEAQIWMMWAIIWLGIYGFMSLGSVVGAYIGKRQDWELWGAWFVFAIIFILLGIMASADCYTQFLTVSQNPEYWALKEILNTIGN